MIRPPTRACLRIRYCPRSIGSGSGFQRRSAVQRPVGPVLVVVGLVVAQGPPEVGLVPGESAVQELAAASPGPALGDGVHAGRPDVAEHGPDPGVGEDRVGRGGEVRAAVADHELDPVGLFAEVHDQVAGLLDGLLSGGMRRDSEDPDASAGVLDHGQDVGLGAIQQVDDEQVAGQDRLGLGTQELRPGRTGPSQRRVNTVGLEDLPNGRRRDLYSQPGQLAVDASMCCQAAGLAWRAR